MHRMSEYWTAYNCHDCGAAPGQVHIDLCDVQRCTVCQGQRMCCECEGHDEDAAAWTGFWPGVREAAELGLFSKFVEGEGWVSCDKDDPDASPDLNSRIVLIAS